METRSYLDKIINSVADPIFVKDCRHVWILLNDAFCKFMGRDRNELIGRSDYDFFPIEADVFRERDELVLHSGMENVNEERFTDAKGNVHTIVTKKTRYQDENGDKFIVGIIRDITERKVAENRLKDTNRRLANIIDFLPDATTGQGTTFDMYLPEHELGVEIVEAQNDEIVPKGTERILLVDDEPVIADLAGTMLGQLGYEVVTRTSSLDALDYFRAYPNTFEL